MRIQLIQPLLKRWNPKIIFVAKSPQDSLPLGRSSELKVDVELELHSCTSSHEVNFLLSILFRILISALMSLQVDTVGEVAKEIEKDKGDSEEDETKVWKLSFV